MNKTLVVSLNDNIHKNNHNIQLSRYENHKEIYNKDENEGEEQEKIIHSNKVKNSEGDTKSQDVVISNKNSEEMSSYKESYYDKDYINTDAIADGSNSLHLTIKHVDSDFEYLSDEPHVDETQSANEEGSGHQKETITSEEPKIIANVDEDYQSDGAFDVHYADNEQPNDESPMHKESEMFDKKYDSFYKNPKRLDKKVVEDSEEMASNAKTKPKNEDNSDDNDGDYDDDDDDDDDEEDSDDGSLPKRSFKKKPQNRYFRKNTNDAIKIIATPYGRVGIVYEKPKSANNDDADESGSPAEDNDDGANIDADDDGRTKEVKKIGGSKSASSSSKITPVITPDGKIALLYRGASETTKYEPINPSFITPDLDNNDSSNNNNNNDNSNNNYTSAIYDTKRKQQILYESSEEDLGYDDDDDDVDDEDSTSRDDQTASNQMEYGNERKVEEIENDSEQIVSYQSELTSTPSSTTTTTSTTTTVHGPEQTIIFNNNTALPIINRPLSEVLGIKKNQFKQFRIKDEHLNKESSTTQSPHLQAGDGALSSLSTSPPLINVDGSISSSASDALNPNEKHFWYGSRTPISSYGASSLSGSSNSNPVVNVDTYNINRQHSDEDNQNGDHNQAEFDDDDDEYIPDNVFSKHDVVNLAIIPHFDEDFEMQQQLHYHNEFALSSAADSHHNYRHRSRYISDDFSRIHCIMQTIMSLAAISTVFGMLGAFFKQRILDQIRIMHW